MSKTKNTHVKEIKKKNHSHEKESAPLETLDPRATNIKKIIEIDITEETVPLDEKAEEETLAAEDAEDAEDAAVEEITLDDDELNPFGDKWEQ